MNSNYQIVEEEFTYNYRSYMACEDQGPDDCVGTSYRYLVVNKRGKTLRTFPFKGWAEDYVKQLRKRAKNK